MPILKSKSLPIYDEDFQGNRFVCGEAWVIKLMEPLNLGNNFSYQHFIDALNIDQKYEISGIFSVNDSVRIIAQGNYGKVTLNTCGNDLADFLRESFDY